MWTAISKVSFPKVHLMSGSGHRQRKKERKKKKLQTKKTEVQPQYGLTANMASQGKRRACTDRGGTVWTLLLKVPMQQKELFLNDSTWMFVPPFPLVTQIHARMSERDITQTWMSTREKESSPFRCQHNTQYTLKRFTCQILLWPKDHTSVFF